jgi:DNA repair exonuclease SbcCD nuclease subunit
MFTLASDLHLAPLIWTDRPQIKGDAYRALESIAEHVTRIKEPLILAGDLFDVRRPPPDAVGAMNRFMSCMEHAGINVFFIQGQHELSRDQTWVGTHCWPVHAHKQKFTIGGRVFYGLDWLPRGELQEALAKIPPEAEILVCHQVWQDFMGTNCATDGAIGEIPPNIKYVLTGDFHKHTISHVNGKVVVSPGSTYIRSISEESQKNFFHATEVRGDLLFKSVPIKSRVVSHLEITTPEQLDAICRNLQALLEVHEDQRQITHIKIQQDLPEWHARLTAAAEGRSHLHLDPQPAPALAAVEVSSGIELAADLSPSMVMSTCAASVVRDNASVLAKVQGVLSHPDRASALDYWAGLYKQHMATPACNATST